MRKLMTIALGVIGVVVVLVLLVAAIGASLPVDHVASVSATYDRPPEEVWRAITDFQSFPSWRTGVDRVEARTFDDGSSGWVEYGSTGPLPMAVVEQVPPRRLVLRIASDELPFGGTWTYELEPTPGGTRVTITENGTVSNVIFRFVARFVMGYTGTMEAYLSGLGSHFGEEVEPAVAG
jgi:uncharacterized protein YndB with AHSA1/START domain